MIKKRVNSASRTVRVTFELPGGVAQNRAAVAGTFNEWNAEAEPMTYVKSRNVWKAGLTLAPGARHEFRYLVDGRQWRNDEAADAYVANPFFEENGVVAV